MPWFAWTPWGDLKQVVVFHEYTHSVLHANLHWLPTWMDEGMAEFYAYTRFQGDHIYVGAPSELFSYLQEWGAHPHFRDAGGRL